MGALALPFPQLDFHAPGRISVSGTLVFVDAKPPQKVCGQRRKSALAGTM
jgi:hypothetical protein